MANERQASITNAQNWYGLGTGLKAGSQFAQGVNDYFTQRLAAGNLRMQASGTEWEAKQYAAQAGEYWRASGDTQRTGWQEAAMRGQRLAQDIGRIYSGSAGAGIDVASDSVRRTEATNRREAEWDVNAINENYAAQANQYMTQAGSAMANYHIGMGNAAAMRQNAKIQRSNAWTSILQGTLSAAGTLMSGYGAIKAMPATGAA